MAGPSHGHPRRAAVWPGASSHLVVFVLTPSHYLGLSRDCCRLYFHTYLPPHALERLGCGRAVEPPRALIDDQIAATLQQNYKDFCGPSRVFTPLAQTTAPLRYKERGARRNNSGRAPRIRSYPPARITSVNRRYHEVAPPSPPGPLSWHASARLQPLLSAGHTCLQVD